MLVHFARALTIVSIDALINNELGARRPNLLPAGGSLTAEGLQIVVFTSNVARDQVITIFWKPTAPIDPFLQLHERKLGEKWQEGTDLYASSIVIAILREMSKR